MLTIEFTDVNKHRYKWTQQERDHLHGKRFTYTGFMERDSLTLASWKDIHLHWLHGKKGFTYTGFMERDSFTLASLKAMQLHWFHVNVFMYKWNLIC